MVLVTIGPLVLLTIEFFQWLGSGENSVALSSFFTTHQQALLAKSIAFSVLVGATSVALGMLAATWIWTRYSSFTRFLLFASLATIAVPPYLHALAWTHLIENLLPDLSTFGYSRMQFTGWIAAWWVQVVTFLPAATGIILFGLLGVTNGVFEAGRVLQSDIMTFAKIIAPLTKPHLLGSFSIICLFTLIDYSVPALFLVDTFAMEIFTEFSANHVSSQAFLVSVPLLIFTFAIAYLMLGAFQKAALQPQLDSQSRCREFRWPRGFIILQCFAFVILITHVVVFGFSLVSLTGNQIEYGSLFASAKDELLLSAFAAAITAVFCLPIAHYVASKIIRIGKLWWLLLLLPLATPAPLVGIGLISLWNHAFSSIIYDGEFILVFTYLARFVPIAVLLMLMQLLRLDSNLIDAARISVQKPRTFWTQIYLPMMGRTALLSAVIVFALALGEVPASLMTTPAGKTTITTRIYNYMHYGASNKIAELALMIPITVILFSSLLAGLMRILGFLPMSKKRKQS